MSNAALASPHDQYRAADELMIDPVMQYDNGSSSSSFEFPRGERAIPKPGAGAATHARCGPSKWEDAEKWLANPLYTSRLKVVALHGHHVMNSSKHLAYSIKDGAAPSSSGTSHMSREDASVPLLEGQEASHSTKARVSPTNGDAALTRRETDLPQQAVCMDIEGPNHSGYAGETNSFAFPAPPSKVRSTNTFDFYPLQEEPSDMKDLSISHESVKDDKPAEPPAWDRTSYVTPDQPAIRSVSMRDMGTDMTPIASQEPSRTGTPIQATTPLMRSPVSSGSSTPQRIAPASSPLQAPDDPTQTPRNDLSTPENDGTTSELGEIEAQMNARKDIQSLGVQLGKINIVAWASKEEEYGDSSKLLKHIDLEEVKKNVLETRAAAWEEAEEAKYLARFEREEAKIQAWENHEKAKAEAEMRRIEVKIEKIRSHAHEKLMNKLAAAKRRAEERRAVAEARRGEQAAKTVAQANHIRRTGRVPSPMLGCALCP